MFVRVVVLYCFVLVWHNHCGTARGIWFKEVFFWFSINTLYDQTYTGSNLKKNQKFSSVACMTDNIWTSEDLNVTNKNINDLLIDESWSCLILANGSCVPKISVFTVWNYWCHLLGWYTLKFLRWYVCQLVYMSTLIHIALLPGPCERHRKMGNLRNEA